MAASNSQKKHTYILDIMLVHGSLLYPTWLSIPALTNIVDRVHTSIRIDLTAAREYRGFKLGCGGPPKLTWSFLAILNRFLRLGPIGRPANPSGFAIKVLEIDVQTPQVPNSAFISAERWEGICRSGRRKRDVLEEDDSVHPEYVIPPTIIAQFLSEHMDRLLRQWDNAYYFEKCELIYERIGIMKLTIDGVPYHEWDMAERLRDARLGDYGFRKEDDPAARHKEWKMNASKVRKRFGLPVLPNADIKADELE